MRFAQKDPESLDREIEGIIKNTETQVQKGCANQVGWTYLHAVFDPKKRRVDWNIPEFQKAVLTYLQTHQKQHLMTHEGLRTGERINLDQTNNLLIGCTPESFVQITEQLEEAAQ